MASRRLFVHAARLAVVAALAWLVHVAHAAFLARQTGADLAAVPVARVRRHLPDAAAIAADSGSVAGGRDVVADSGDRVGTIFKTSPVGDAAIGFSGPTDLLVVCDANLRVAGVEILASRDTRDHVAAIERDGRFLAALRGRSLAELERLAAGRVDAVAGSTLTCLAIAESLALRLGGSAAGSRFTTQPALADLRTIFPGADAVEPDAGDPSVIRVLAADRSPLGWGLRTSPAADRVIGYQGPTDAVVGFDATGRVCGVIVGASYDNEPYVGYVRDDQAFRRVYRGMTIEELTGLDPQANGVEGVSGATMTSQAVAEGIVRAARAHAAAPPAGRSRLAALARDLDGPRLGALGLVVAGIVTAFTRARGTWFGRLALPLAVLAYLGFGAGALLSQAQFWGWAQAGVPPGAVVLAVLAAAALVLPATTRKNVYCAHLCAHGAAQQLLVRFAKPKRSVPARLRPWLAVLPWTLLTLAILTALFHLPLNLVDLEPFDAYLPAVAGTAALAIFAGSLVASAWFPMAYCRHACPTGALLDHLRLHARSDRFTWRDGVVLGCLALAILQGAAGQAMRAFAQRAGAGGRAPPRCPTLAGPALGTTYRVTLARDVPRMTPGAVHREIEGVLAGVDRALSTWRDDSDVSRFNRAPAGEWVAVSPDLVAVVAIARRVHDDTGAAFDITAVAGAVAGTHLVELREQPPALRKLRDGVALDLGGIGPGYAVDAIGTRLVALGSAHHLVELGGEVRAWGSSPSGGPWRVAVRGTPDVWGLAPGEAVATSTARPGRSPVDPRTGRVVSPRIPAATVRAATCAEADARAVAALVTGDDPLATGLPSGP